MRSQSSFAQSIRQKLPVLIPVVVLAVAFQATVAATTSTTEITAPPPAATTPIWQAAVETAPSTPALTAAAAVSTTSIATTGTWVDADEDVTDSDQVLRMGLLQDMTTTNYWHVCQETIDINSSVLGSTRPSLYSLAMPGINVVPDLALDPDPPRPRSEGDVWIVDVSLRADAVWSDGQAISASDVAFTFNLAQEIGLVCLDEYGVVEAGSDRVGVLSVDATDERKVRITFNRDPGLGVWPHTIGVAPIMAEHFWAPHWEAARAAARDAVKEIANPAAAVWGKQQDAAESAGLEFDKSIDDVTDEEIDRFLNGVYQTTMRRTLFAVTGVGDPSGGPMVFAERTPNLRIRNVANPRYYRSGDVVESGGVAYTMGPFIEEQVFSVYDTMAGLVSALAEGQIDHALVGQSSPAVTNLVESSGAVTLTNPVNGLWYLGFNLRKSPTSDPAFRRALATMIDRDFLANDLFQGATVPLWSLIPAANLQYFDPDAGAEIASKYRNLRGFERLEAAVAILEEAGYTWERKPSVGVDRDGEPVVEPGHGVMHPDGSRVPELEILSLAPGTGLVFFASYAVYIARWLEDLGFEARAHITEAGMFTGQVWPGIGVKPTFDLYLNGWLLGSPAFPTFHDAFFHSRNLAEINDGHNAVGYINPELDQLAEQLWEVKTAEEAKQILWQLETIIDRDLPYVVLNTWTLRDVVSKRLDLPFTETLNGLVNLTDFSGLVRIRE
jgi:ABC-type transport system substrate-binding protein